MWLYSHMWVCTVSLTDISLESDSFSPPPPLPRQRMLAPWWNFVSPRFSLLSAWLGGPSSLFLSPSSSSYMLGQLCDFGQHQQIWKVFWFFSTIFSRITLRMKTFPIELFSGDFWLSQLILWRSSVFVWEDLAMWPRLPWAVWWWRSDWQCPRRGSRPGSPQFRDLQSRRRGTRWAPGGRWFRPPSRIHQSRGSCRSYQATRGNLSAWSGPESRSWTWTQCPDWQSWSYFPPCRTHCWSCLCSWNRSSTQEQARRQQTLEPVATSGISFYNNEHKIPSYNVHCMALLCLTVIPTGSGCTFPRATFPSLLLSSFFGVPPCFFLFLPLIEQILGLRRYWVGFTSRYWLNDFITSIK